MTMFIIILSTVFLVGYSTACVEWTIRNPPIIFGKTAELICVLEINRTHQIREWQGGKDYKLLTTNGASSDDKKYAEILHLQDTRLESVLQIYRFNENDVNCDYSCTVDQDEKRQKLTLNPKEFEMHPTKTTSTVVSLFRNNNLDVFIELRKVYPKPKCKVMFNEVEITKRLSTKRDLNGIFYMMKEKLHHEFPNHICSGKLVITCLIGGSNIKLHEEKLEICTINPKPTYNEPNDNFIVAAVIGFVLFAFVVIALASLARYGKLRNVLSCFVSWRGENILDQSQIPIIAKQVTELMNSDNQKEENV